MVTREQMHSVTQGIISSYEARAEGVADIRKATQSQRNATQAQLKDVASAREGMAKQLRADLGKSRDELAKDVDGWLKDVAAARQGMAKQLRADLGKSRDDLAKDVDGWLKGVAAARQGMARQLRADLGKGRDDLAKDVDGWLKGVAAARQGMAKQLRADLGKGRDDLAKDVDGWLKDVAAAHQGARAEWQSMAATLQAKRAGAVLTKEVPAREEGEEVAGVEVGEETAEFISLSKRAFEHLAEHPDGSRLVELERGFGVSRIQMFRVVKKLINEGKVEKRGILYFAI